jgi:DNA-directed RNA polymerase subunit M/transcription elongation factor TFIIS
VSECCVAAIAANLTQEVVNGNTELLQRITRRHDASPARGCHEPLFRTSCSTFTDLDTPTERSPSKATLRKSGTMSPHVHLPRAGSSCLYTELQTRSADEGTTIFPLPHVLHTMDRRLLF